MHLIGIFIGIFGAVLASLGYFSHDIKVTACGLVACLIGVWLLCAAEG